MAHMQPLLVIIIETCVPKVTSDISHLNYGTCTVLVISCYWVIQGNCSNSINFAICSTYVLKLHVHVGDWVEHQCRGVSRILSGTYVPTSSFLTSMWITRAQFFYVTTSILLDHTSSVARTKHFNYEQYRQQLPRFCKTPLPPPPPPETHILYTIYQYAITSMFFSWSI